MEPRIQYAQTLDGVSIAFSTLGEGMPLVIMPYIYGHLELEWQVPEIRRWYERLAEKRMPVRFDMRGTGVSQREIPVISSFVGPILLDLEAVVNRAGIKRFALYAPDHAGPAAIVYAAAHPERVSHLLLWNSYVKASEWVSSPHVQATRALIEKDWATYTETAAHVMFGWSEGEQARRFAALIREAVSPELVIARMKTGILDEVDVTAYLPQVTQPTLVLHRRQSPWPGVDAARNLAGGIANARLALLEGTVSAPAFGDTDAVLRAIDEFLDEGETEAVPERPSGTAVILFADIADSTGLTERLGDAAFREKARAFDGALRRLIRENGGIPVEGKLLGDGVLAVFTSARQGIEAALACGRAGDEAGLPLHLGLHAGDVIREENNVYGGAVNIAARISALSAPGEVLVSATVRSLARTSAGVSFEDRGERELKGVGEPVRVWAVRAQESD